MMQTLTQRTVADLIVILQTDHTTVDRDTRRIGPTWFTEMLGKLPRVKPPSADRERQIFGGAAEVAIVPFRIAREETPALVVKVVGPDGVQTPAALLLSSEHHVEIAVIFGHDQDLAASGRCADPRGQFGEKVATAVVGDRGASRRAEDHRMHTHAPNGRHFRQKNSRTVVLWSPSKLRPAPQGVWCRSVK